MLAGLPVPNDAVEDLADLVWGAGADELADRLDRAVADEVKLLALTLIPLRRGPPQARSRVPPRWRVRRIASGTKSSSGAS